MERKTLRKLEEKNIESIVSGAATQINAVIAPNSFSGMITTLMGAIHKGFETIPDMKNKGSIALMPGRTPAELRGYLFAWEKQDGAYQLSIRSATGPCTEAELDKGFSALTGYLNRKGIPEA
jgi:hypothetical protein